MRTARVSRWIPALLVLAACGPFKEAPREGDPIREDEEVTPASAVYADEEPEPPADGETPSEPAEPPPSDDAGGDGL